MSLFCCGFLILTSSAVFSIALNQINFDVFKDKRLLSGSITTTSVRSALACVALCTFDKKCCSSNYEKGSKLCTLETSCMQNMEPFLNSQVMIKVINWIPVLVAYSGNEQSVYTAWTNQTECNDLTTPLDISVTTRHLRNPLIDRWTDVGVKKVKVQLFTNNVPVVWMLFNGEDTNEMNWFSQENLMNSSFNDLTTSSPTNYFGIVGHWSQLRHFFINRAYVTCGIDDGWLVVLGDRKKCAWEQRGLFPLFLYTKSNSPRNWVADCAEPADRMIISVGAIAI
ncbi:uncharacterized protein [Mytilus edulis]|uniref:uncharacterized protein n=1 Tax=Mytilus edulis TaxID=6550 RepID=UPI0039EFFF9E